MSRKLFIISTPIGNLSDLTDRARSTLKDVDLIFAEDTRVSIKLLRHLNLPTRTSSGKDRMISCHKFNEQSRLPELEKAFEEGLDVALVSDAGTPLLSDPGQKLVQNAIELGFEIFRNFLTRESEIISIARIIELVFLCIGRQCSIGLPHHKIGKMRTCRCSLRKFSFKRTYF